MGRCSGLVFVAGAALLVLASLVWSSTALVVTALLLMACSVALAFANRLAAWGPRAASYLPKQTALDRTYHFDGEVLIVGAGAAGLAAARVLEDNQIRYSILEATDRYGGRLKEDASFADIPIDLAAEWIHNLPGILDVLSGKPGLAAQTELVPQHFEEACGTDGHQLKKSSGLSLDFYFWMFPEYKFKSSTWFSFARQHYGERVAHRIRYGSPVTKVDYSGARVRVDTPGASFVADKVLLTASVGVLKSGDIAFVPDLPQQKKDALAAVRFPPGFKLVLKFREKFYPDAIAFEPPDGGNKGGEKTFFDAMFKKDSRDNLLGVLVVGASSEPYYALESEEQIVNRILEELDVLYDGTPSRCYMNEFRMEDWGRHEYTQGTWVEGFQIKPSTLRELNRPLLGGGDDEENKVYFAGEAHDVNRQLGVPGAILSGFDAVEQMLGGGNPDPAAIVVAQPQQAAAGGQSAAARRAGRGTVLEPLADGSE